jgi:hypothetical protein
MNSTAGAPVVLMARPHPFVATAMRDLLATLGCTPIAPDSERVGITPVGVVISLALQSSVRESAVEVYERIRATYRRSPVVFVSLADTATILAGLERSLKNLPSPPHVVTLDDTTVGTPGTALFLTKADIESRSAHVQAQLRLHFRL